MASAPLHGLGADRIPVAALEGSPQREAVKHLFGDLLADASDDPDQLFRLGELSAHRNMQLDRRYASTPWFELLDRFATGDFGMLGNVADVGLTDEHLLDRAIQPPLVRNALAIKTGSGGIQARYKVEVPTVNLIGRTLRTSIEVRILTSLRPGATLTLFSGGGVDAYTDPF